MGRKKGSKNKISTEVVKLARTKVRKPRQTNIKNRIKKLTTKIGANKGQLVIFEKGERFILSQRIQVQGKKDKFKSLISLPNLENIQTIASELSENLKLAYNSEPETKVGRSKSAKIKGFDVDHSIFRKYGNEHFIFLGFGSIFLEKSIIRTKRNWEKIDGWKIFELIQAKKVQVSFDECKQIILNYSQEQKRKLLKEISRLGDRDDLNTVRVVLEFKPVVVSCDGESGILTSKEVDKNELPVVVESVSAEEEMA